MGGHLLTLLRSLFVVLLLAVGHNSAGAETVRVERGETDLGAGWLFIYGADGICRLATPLHVAARDGVPLPSLGIVLRDGRRLDAVAPTVPDPATDLAFYEVIYPRNGPLCTDSRLGLDNLQKLLARTAEATLVSADSGQMRLREVAVDATDVDDDGGRLFTIKLRADGDQIQQGMSGSAVLVGTTPLGLLLATSEFDGTLGVVLRFDVIKRLFASASNVARPRASPSAPVGVALLSRGERVSAKPIGDLSSGGAATIRSVGRRAELELHLPDPGKLRTLSVKIEAVGRADTLAVSLRTARTAASSWTPAARCRPAGETWVCLGGDRTIARLSIIIVTTEETEMVVSDLELTTPD
jgi:hypothetical protein